MLIAKYDATILKVGVENLDVRPYWTSKWWKDILSLNGSDGVKWFSREVIRRIGNGRNISFWNDSWVEEIPLRERFPPAFSLYQMKRLPLFVM